MNHCAESGKKQPKMTLLYCRFGNTTRCSALVVALKAVTDDIDERTFRVSIPCRLGHFMIRVTGQALGRYCLFVPWIGSIFMSAAPATQALGIETSPRQNQTINVKIVKNWCQLFRQLDVSLYYRGHSHHFAFLERIILSVLSKPVKKVWVEGILFA